MHTWSLLIDRFHTKFYAQRLKSVSMQMEEKIQRIRVLTRKEMQQFLPTSSRDRANYDRHKNEREVLTQFDFDEGPCTLNNQIEEEPSSIVFFPGATLPGIEKINNKEPNYAEEGDSEDSEKVEAGQRD